MGASVLDQPIFHDDNAAREYLENLRWPDGIVCPHCGVVGESTKLAGKKHRPGVYKCNACRKQFTVTVGTVFERSKVPLHKWLLATYLLCSSKKGISSHTLMRTLGVQYKTAWFMAHRIREAMRQENGLLGGCGETVECDETYWGREDGKPVRPSGQNKNKIFTLVERNGEARSFRVQRVTTENLRPIMLQHIDDMSRICTDEGRWYRHTDEYFAKHETVNHMSGEYQRGSVHTNTVEGYFATLKRGLDGVYQHVDSCHLDRYLAEFDFRYNHRDVSDLRRTSAALTGIAGKRLYYKH